MILRQTTEAELEALHTETFINTSNNKVTKVTDHSALRGIIRGNVRTAKKAVKDIALATSRLFPDSAFDATLDQVADDRGVAPRFSASQSSTFVRLIADEGTFYEQGVNTISDNKGNIFDLENDVTIGTKGFDYVKVRCQQSGAFTNVDPYTLVNISPEPTGHIGVINEYGATGGRDAEDDDLFKQRIKEGPDILARGTLSYLTQVFMKINSNVLRAIFEGTNQTGKVVLGILTQNGINLTADELQTLLEQGGQYFSLTELAPIGTQSYGVELKNADYYYIDSDLRIDLFTGASFDAVVKDIQQKWSKLVDFRFWDSTVDRVEWDSLLSIAKSTGGVKSVPDTYFTPAVDITLLPNQFPRFRGFVARDLQGNIIINQTGTVDPLFYSNDIDQSFSATVL